MVAKCIGSWTPTVHQNFSRPGLIWDIDGTLLEPLGVGREALNKAFALRFGVSDAFNGLDFAGATDHALWRAVARRTQVPEQEASRFFPLYVQYLRERLASSPLHPLPGAVNLITTLSMQGWPLALGTGNMRPGAYAKLGAVGLAPYFPSGGFSEPGHTRRDILHRAAESIPAPHFIVIGDTPRDIEAAHGAGFVCLAVATGRFDPKTLVTAGADLVLDDLSLTPRFFDAIHQLSIGRPGNIAPGP